MNVRQAAYCNVGQEQVSAVSGMLFSWLDLSMPETGSCKYQNTVGTALVKPMDYRQIVVGLRYVLSIMGQLALQQPFPPAGQDAARHHLASAVG